MCWSTDQEPGSSASCWSHAVPDPKSVQRGWGQAAPPSLIQKSGGGLWWTRSCNHPSVCCRHLCMKSSLQYIKSLLFPSFTQRDFSRIRPWGVFFHVLLCLYLIFAQGSRSGSLCIVIKDKFPHFLSLVHTHIQQILCQDKVRLNQEHVQTQATVAWATTHLLCLPELNLSNRE